MTETGDSAAPAASPLVARAWLRLVLALLGGVAAGYSYAFDTTPLQFVFLVPIGLVLSGLNPRQAILPAAIFGFATHLTAYYWILYTLRVFSGFPLIGCVPLYALLCLAQGSTISLSVWLAHRASARGYPLVLTLPAAFAACELAYPLLFPSYEGDRLHLWPTLLQTADLGGVILVSVWLVLLNAVLLELALALGGRGRLAWPRLAAALALLAAGWGYGAWRVAEVDARIAAAPRLRVGLVQGNLGLQAKHDNPAEGLKRYLEQSEALEREERPDLIIWPESAYNYLLPPGQTDLGPAVTMGRLRTPLLFGAIRAEQRPDRRHHFNTAALLDAAGQLIGTYDKTFLLLFGEWLPFGESFPGLYELSPNTGRFTPGSHQRPLTLGPWRLSVLVCYEDILPGFVRAAVREGQPHLLVNLTNDSWFGPTREPWIHLALSKLRAVEHHRFLVRSTVTGVSAVIDPVGRLGVHGGVFRRESLVGEVRLLEGRTVYERLGDWPGWLGLGATAWMSLRRRVGRTRRPSGS